MARQAPKRRKTHSGKPVKVSASSEPHEMESKVTLTHFISEERKKYPESTGQMTELLNGLATAARYTSAKIRAAGVFHPDLSSSPDEIEKLGKLCNEAFKISLRRSRTVRIIVSQEEKEAVIVPVDDRFRDAHYVCAIDPLDGASNVDANVSIGTIMGIWRTPDWPPLDSTAPAVAEILRPGSELITSAYVMYGSATVLVLANHDGVNGFTLDPSSGEFVRSHPNISIPQFRSIYSVNYGNRKYFYGPTKKYIEQCESSNYSLRYVGSMVADVHRTLLYGGIFMYPADKNSSAGKLRLLYEIFPLAYIIHKAGGKATSAHGNVLEIVPTDIHQSSGIYLGSSTMVDEVEKLFQGWTIDSSGQVQPRS